MRALKLHSCLATQIRSFIRLRQLSGTDYCSQAQLLGYFDRFLLKKKVCKPRITAEITDAYQQTLSHLAPRSQSNRFSVIRQLCQYLSRTDPLGHVPEPLRRISSRAAYQPYIYSEAEIRALLANASRLPPPESLRPHTYRTLLGLLYCTGIRIGEAFALNLKDFHAPQQRLYIAEGKFHKARWIPLSPSTCGALHRYVQRRLQRTPCSPDSPLFLNQRGRRLHHVTVHQTFQHLWMQSTPSQKAPRIHDLRHTFAVHRLLAWYRDGKDVNARLPWLATYMGHVDICSTQVYLHPTAELLEQVGSRFHRHYLHRVKKQGVR